MTRADLGSSAAKVDRFNFRNPLDRRRKLPELRGNTFAIGLFELGANHADVGRRRHASLTRLISSWRTPLVPRGD